jgi:hypothetical protein
MTEIIVISLLMSLIIISCFNIVVLVKTKGRR